MKSKKIKSLNASFSELELEQLEKRLETNPLIGGLPIDLQTSVDLLGIDCNYMLCPGFECNQPFLCGHFFTS